jgi:hypothetical protein
VARTRGLAMHEKWPKWQGGTVASRRQRSGGGLSRRGEMLQKGKEALAGRSLLYPRGERERCVVTHVSNWPQALSQTGGAKCASGFPYLESLTGGPQLAFERWCESPAVSGRTVPGLDH